MFVLQPFQTACPFVRLCCTAASLPPSTRMSNPILLSSLSASSRQSLSAPASMRLRFSTSPTHTGGVTDNTYHQPPLDPSFVYQWTSIGSTHRHRPRRASST